MQLSMQQRRSETFAMRHAVLQAILGGVAKRNPQNANASVHVLWIDG